MAVLDDVLMMQKKNITHGLQKNGIQESNVTLNKGSKIPSKLACGKIEFKNQM